MDMLLWARWILVIVLFMVHSCKSLLNPDQDCRTLEQGPYYFKKIDRHTYQCVRDGPIYECHENWSIPDWYEYGHSDPCKCLDIKENGYVCPNDPLAGQRTTEDPITTTPVIGTIGDNGCPSPFQKFENTLRIYNNTDGKEFSLTSSLGLLSAEDECKYHCLTVATCTGVTYSIQNDVPMCIGFFNTPTSYDFRGSSYHSYFERVWCISSSPPLQPTPPPIQNGLLFQNTKQSGDEKYAFLTGVSELSCYAWCYYEPSCAAVDYNKITFTCYYYRETSCEAHAPALDQCCNHYKKKITKC